MRRCSTSTPASGLRRTRVGEAKDEGDQRIRTTLLGGATLRVTLAHLFGVLGKQLSLDAHESSLERVSQLAIEQRREPDYPGVRLRPLERRQRLDQDVDRFAGKHPRVHELMLGDPTDRGMDTVACATGQLRVLLTLSGTSYRRDPPIGSRMLCNDRGTSIRIDEMHLVVVVDEASQVVFTIWREE